MRFRSQLAGLVASPPPASLRDRVLAEIAETRQLGPELDVEVSTQGSVDLPIDADTNEPTTLIAFGDEQMARRRSRRLTGLPTWVLSAAAALLLLLGAVVVFDRDEPDPIDELVAARDAVTVALTGSTADPADVIEVVWSPGRSEAAVLADQLAVLDPDKAYELWFLLDDGVAPAGLFVPDENGVVRAFLEVGDEMPNGWGVTVEPASGSLQPTGEVILAGTF